MWKKSVNWSKTVAVAMLIVAGVALNAGCHYDKYLGKFQTTWTPNGVRVECVAGGKQCIKGVSVFFGNGK